MKTDVLIIGAGAQAKYALEIYRLRGMRVRGILPLPQERPDEKLRKYLLSASLDRFEEIYTAMERPGILLVSSKPAEKERLRNRIEKFGPVYINAVHPAAVVATNATLGCGIIINASAVIQPYAVIADHVMVHAGVIVEHDCVIEDYANLAPGVKLAGYVRVGKGAVIYTGAVVVPTVSIGEYSTVGAGAVVLDAVASNTTVVGIPAQEVVPGQGRVHGGRNG